MAGEIALSGHVLFVIQADLGGLGGLGADDAEVGLVAQLVRGDVSGRGAEPDARRPVAGEAAVVVEGTVVLTVPVCGDDDGDADGEDDERNHHIFSPKG